jgi:hypothetical protein
MASRSGLSWVLPVVLLAGCHKGKPVPSPGFPATPPPDSPIAGEPSARRIQALVLKAYAGLSSYQDRGVVLTTIKRGGAADPSKRKPFTTAFTRDGRFRFEFRDPHSPAPDPRYIVWSEGTEARTWWGLVERNETFPTLKGALAKAAGVSGGASAAVPYLLLPPHGEITAIGSADAYRIADGVHDGRPCYRIQSLEDSDAVNDHVGADREEPAARSKTTFWVDQASNLLLRVDQTTNFSATARVPAFQSESQTLYSPTFNQPLPPELLSFGR